MSFSIDIGGLVSNTHSW